MLSRRNFVTFVIVTYLVLLIFFFAYKEHQTYNNACTYGQTCVRFCCSDADLCKVNVIETYFNASEIPGIKDDMKMEYKILFGKPLCKGLVPLEPDRDFEFTYYGAIMAKEGSTGKPFYYDYDDFCFEGKNYTDNFIEWDVKYCKGFNEIRIVFHNYLMTIALLFTAVTLAVYVLSNSKNTVAGRCEFMLLLGIFFFNVSYPLLHNGFRTYMEVVMTTLLAGLLMMFLWLFVLIFDIWSTFWNRRTIEDVSKRFRVYCWFVFGVIFLLVLSVALAEMGINSFRAILRILDDTLLISFFGLIIADVILLLWTGYMVFKLSKTSRSTDHAWFEAETERFWTYLGIFSVMALTLWVEMYSLRLKDSYESKIVIDFVKLFSTIVIFVILAQKKLTTLMKRYDTLHNATGI